MIVFLLALVALGLLTAGPPQPTDGIASTIASGLAALAKFVLPDFVGPFVSRMFGNVAWSLTCSAGFLISAVLSLYWKKRINDTTRLAWNSLIRHQDRASTPAVD